LRIEEQETHLNLQEHDDDDDDDELREESSWKIDISLWKILIQ